ncbi:MAG: hypothetical protein J5605_01025, partial [Bacteroidales bacterium]|nr:hypothetical protein [Bacteroidales bacterium]
MRRIYIVLAFCLTALPVLLKAQSATDTVPYCCDFENQVEHYLWRYANNTAQNGSRWIINSATQNGVGVNSLYISNDGISHNYAAVQSHCYAYRRLHIPAGIYDVSYDWHANGYYSTSYAFLRAFLLPDNGNVTFTAGQYYAGLSATSLPTGAISLDGNAALLLQSSWQTYSNPIVQVPTTGDYYLVFFWYNSSSSSTSYQPPAAIDNICIEPVSCPRPYNISKNALGNGCVELTWTDFGNPQPIGWIIEYGQYGFTEGTGTKRFTTSKPDTICGLMDDVTYDFMIRAICDSTDTSKSSDRIHVRYCSQITGCIDFT